MEKAEQSYCIQSNKIFRASSAALIEGGGYLRAALIQTLNATKNLNFTVIENSVF